LILSTPFEILAGVVLVLLVINIYLLFRVHALSNRLKAMLRSTRVENIEELLLSLIEELTEFSKTAEQIKLEHQKLSKSVKKALQRVGAVRFSAFDDTGGDQSFALALLDDEGNGTVLNSLYHRDMCRIYMKPITNWASPYALTDEEQEAIRRAKMSKPDS